MSVGDGMLRLLPRGRCHSGIRAATLPGNRQIAILLFVSRTTALCHLFVAIIKERRFFSSRKAETEDRLRVESVVDVGIGASHKFM